MAKRKKCALGARITGGIPDVNAWLDNEKQNLAKAKAEAENSWGVSALNMASDIVSMLSSSISADDKDDKLVYAGGGIVPIEVEGGEVVEQPGMDAETLIGNSHEEGGIPIDVIPGTEIFSRRLKGPDNKTMAERKETRDKKKDQLLKHANKNKFNKIITDSVERELASLDIEEQQDLEYMEMVKNLAQQQQQAFDTTMEFAFGGVVDVNFEEQAQMQGMTYEEFATHVLENTNEYPSNIVEQARNVLSVAQEFNFGGKVRNYFETHGADILGGLSILSGARKQKQNIENMRANELPVIDYMKELESSAETNYDRDRETLSRTYQNENQNLQRQAKAAKTSAFNTARSLNTSRALSANIDAGVQASKFKLYDKFLNALNAKMSERDKLKDTIAMQKANSATRTDLTRAANQDAYYTGLSQIFADATLGYQQFAKHLNQMQTTRTQGRLLAGLSKYGITVDVNGNFLDKNGNIIDITKLLDV